MTVLAPVPIMMVQNDLEVDIMGFCRVATVMDNDDHVSIVQLEHIQTAEDCSAVLTLHQISIFAPNGHRVNVIPIAPASRAKVMRIEGHRS